MTAYLDESYDMNNPDIVSVYDEFPIWSSYFGIKLLELVNYRSKITALDVGCGAGFPLIELAQRLGESSAVFGIDVWASASKRINLKLRTLNIKNVVFLNQPAEFLPFGDNTFDLIVSNNGINNVQDPVQVLSECFRVMKDGGQFLMSVNLPGTMIEFYTVFRKVLEKHKLFNEVLKMNDHIRLKRKTSEENMEILNEAGFKTDKVVNDLFYMQYADGTSFLNHYFIKLAFLESWKNILDGKNVKNIFTEIERELNKLAVQKGHLKLTVPFVVFDTHKCGLMYIIKNSGS